MFAAQCETVGTMCNQKVLVDVFSACDCDHVLWKCRRFLDKSIQERWNFVRGKRLCFNCLGVDHLSRNCGCKSKCKTCSRPQHTSLHKDFVQRAPKSSSSVWKKAFGCKGSGESDSSNAKKSTADPAVTVSVLTGSYKVRLMVLPVRAYGDNVTNFVDTYAFLDRGSEMSFCTMKLMQKLRLHGKEVTKNIVSLSGSRSHHGSMVTLSVKGFAESNVIRIQDVFAIDRLPKLTESIPSDNDVKRYKHLRGLHFPEVHSNEVKFSLVLPLSKRMKSPTPGVERTRSRMR